MILNDQKRKELGGHFNILLDTYVSKYGKAKKEVAERLNFHPMYISMSRNQLQWAKLPQRFWELLDEICGSGMSLAEYLKDKPPAKDNRMDVGYKRPEKKETDKEPEPAPPGEELKPFEAVTRAIKENKMDGNKAEGIIKILAPIAYPNKAMLTNRQLEDLYNKLNGVSKEDIERLLDTGCVRVPEMKQSVKIDLELNLVLKLNGKEITV